MPLENISKPPFSAWQTAVPLSWRKPLFGLSVAWAAMFTLTWNDWQAMFDQWWNISTYNHILFVPLIIGWLVHTRWASISGIEPRAWWPGVAVLAVTLLGWLLGTLAGINSVSQLGAVAALQASLLALLGPRVFAANLFPICYALFLVPFGDELVPALQMLTAEMVIALTRLSGIPAIVDGVFIETPVGLFEVAEACSGVKFLVAMIALGTLVAYACFEGWRRRLVFMAAAIALPVLANGVRAWGTIYIAQSEGIAFAEGFDHIFYGWVFFALVVGALLAAAWPWFDRHPEDLATGAALLRIPHWLEPYISFGRSRRTATMTAAILACVVSFALWNDAATGTRAALGDTIEFASVPGWTQTDYTPTYDWQPRATGADHRLIGRFIGPKGQQIDAFVALYADQGEGREATAFGEGALVPDSDWRWMRPGPDTPNAQSDWLLVHGQHKRLAQTSFRTGDLLTGSAFELKLAAMRNRLLLRDEATAMLILSSELQADGAAQDAIADFRQAIGDEREWLDRMLHDR